MKKTILLTALASLLAAGAQADPVPFSVDDLDLLAEVAEPVFAPDGLRLAYSVTVANLEADEPQSDLWTVSWDGAERRALTSTPDSSEWQPAYSPDGKWLAFLSDRGVGEKGVQVWLMPSQGGAARALTSLGGDVEDFAWSPDGKRMAVIALDPEFPVGEEKPPKPRPIVIERYQFKEDEVGYLTSRRKHLYLLDVASGVHEILTAGDHDEQLPSWSPDGRLIAYVTKRGEDPDRHLNFDIYLIEPRAGAPERRLTSFQGSDLDPYWDSRPEWSPDSARIAYLRNGEDRWIYYSPWQLAVVDVATGRESIPAPIDRCFFKPRWSPDGRSVLSLIEQSRVTQLSRISIADGKVEPLTQGLRFDADFAIAPDGRVAVLGGDALRPYEIAAVEGAGLRPLTDHNAFLGERRLAPVEPIEFRSRDGTRIEGFLVKPLDYDPARKYPTILRIHGGPVYQFSFEFMPDWQAYAAAGYVVVAANPRGSSGRGFEFSKAIYADWGNLDVDDVLAAVDHVVKLGVADPERLGVGGRSYGGMLTNYVIARDDRFKAAVSGAGTSNMLATYGYDQYTREYELELGRPWDDRAAYERVSYPFFHADRIRTPTAFYCAEKDFNVPCIGSEQMYQALRSLGVPTELVIYPDEYHGLTVPSYLRDRMQRHLAWYRRFLGPGLVTDAN